MAKEMICAGFGGQGVLTAGMILINAGMELDKNVLFYPSYGSEMRGGTANCTVKISDGLIASPISKNPDILLTMNTPAIDKFEDQLKPGGLLLVNSSIVPEDRTYRDDIKVVKIPATDIAWLCWVLWPQTVTCLRWIIWRRQLYLSLRRKEKENSMRKMLPVIGEVWKANNPSA